MAHAHPIPSGSKIRLLIADDHTVTVAGLRAILEHEPDITVVGTAANGRDAVRLTDELLPAVVIMDISMPDLNGVDATRQLLQQHPEIRVIGLTMHGSRGFLAEMFRAGASGFLLKNAPPEEIISAVRAVLANRTAVSAEFRDGAAELARMGTTTDRLPDAGDSLTARENEVLRLLVEGMNLKQIAERLQISYKTIEMHRLHIMEKLGLYNLADLTRYAIREGIITLKKVQLTDREREILQLIAEGKSMGEIAETLHLSSSTVHSHRQHLMEKLQMDNIADLTRYALYEGLAFID